MKYQVNGPEGFPISREGFDTVSEAVVAAAKFITRFIHQGYYVDGNMTRRTLDWVAERLSVYVEDEEEYEEEGECA
jgi:hypothetical protein